MPGTRLSIGDITVNRTDKNSVPMELIQAGKHTGTYSVRTWRVLQVQAKGMVTRDYVRWPGKTSPKGNKPLIGLEEAHSRSWAEQVQSVKV